MSAATMSTDGWTVVGRPKIAAEAPASEFRTWKRDDAPSAFSRGGGGGRPSRFHARLEEEARIRHAAEEIIRREEAAARKVTHMEEFPMLGSAAAPKTKSALNWASTAAAAAAKPQPIPVKKQGTPEEHRARLSRIPTRAYDDGLAEDYDGPDEDYDFSDNESDMEFNADLESGRRRGDKGIW